LTPIKQKNHYVMFGGMCFDKEQDTAVAKKDVFLLHLKG